ncbi:hypothetical protein OROGR_014973 [Orobanche gracilis]
MPIEADYAVWGALLNACKIHGDSDMIEKIGRLINGGGDCRGASGGALICYQMLTRVAVDGAIRMRFALK